MIFLLLGSNIGDRLFFLRAAFQHIEREIGSIKKQSAIYQTEAWGLKDQKDFYNMAVAVHSQISPSKLLEKTKEIEKMIGTAKTKVWGPRQIDIDILLYDQEIISEERLTIPHAKLHQRNFALIPLLEIAPKIQHPVYGKLLIDLYLDNEDESEVVKLEDIHLDAC